jgi:hypothetical protein
MTAIVKQDPVEIMALPVAKNLCQILMDCLLGSLDLEKHSLQLLESLSPIIQLAKELSVQNEKGDAHLLLPEITKCFKLITENLGLMLAAIKAYMKTPDKLNLQENLTKSIYELAESICHMTDLINECSTLRMFKLLKKAVLYLAEMERLIKAPPEQRPSISKVTQACEDTNTKIITVTTNALNYSKNEQKKELFNLALDKLENASPRLIDMAKRLTTNHQDYKTRALSISTQVAGGFQDVMSALKISEDSAFQTVWDTLNYVNVVIKSSRELELGAHSIYDSVNENAPPEEIEELHQLIQELAQSVIQQLNDYMTTDPNPTKRAFYEQVIWDLEDKLRELTTATNAALEGQSGALKLLENFYKDMTKITRRLCTGPEEEVTADTTPIAYTTALTELSDAVSASANKNIRDSYISAQNFATIAGNLDKVMDKIIHQSNTSNKDKIIEKRQLLREQTKSVLLAAHTFNSQPSMIHEQTLSQEQDKLNSIMNEIHQLEEEFDMTSDNPYEDLNELEPTITISGDDIDTSFL